MCRSYLHGIVKGLVGELLERSSLYMGLARRIEIWVQIPLTGPGRVRRWIIAETSLDLRQIVEVSDSGRERFNKYTNHDKIKKKKN